MGWDFKKAGFGVLSRRMRRPRPLRWWWPPHPATPGKRWIPVKSGPRLPTTLHAWFESATPMGLEAIIAPNPAPVFRWTPAYGVEGKDSPTRPSARRCGPSFSRTRAPGNPSPARGATSEPTRKPTSGGRAAAPPEPTRAATDLRARRTPVASDSLPVSNHAQTPVLEPRGPGKVGKPHAWGSR